MNFASMGLVVAVLAAPCVWDHDTLADELRENPEGYDLVTGRLYRHTTAYYERRVEHLDGREARTLAEYDDLAVAWERLGDRTRALEAIEAKRAALGPDPDAKYLYRHHANLGTFYARDGQFEQASVEIERAVALNSGAQFARERCYQIALIRYVADARKDPRLWPAENFVTWSGGTIDGSFLRAITRKSLELESPRDRRGMVESLAGDESDEAIEVVAGMMRSGGLEGPELYRTLGDLFEDRHDFSLAWFAWKRALEAGHPALEVIEQALTRVEDHWSEVPFHDPHSTFVPLTDEDYRRHRASADAWLAAFQAAEDRALAAGSDPGDPAVLRELVAEADALVPHPETDQVTYRRVARKWLILALLGLLIYSPFYVCGRLLKWRDDRRAPSIEEPEEPDEEVRRSA